MNTSEFGRLPLKIIRATALAALSVLFASGIVGTTRTTPVTMAFNAAVVEVRSFSPLSLPFSVNVGDEIKGSFSYEPSPSGNFGSQQTPISFELGGSTIASSAYNIYRKLNEWPPFTPEGYVSSQPVIDYISIDCSELGPACTPGIVPGTDDVHWRPILDLAGVSPTLHSLDLFSDPATWNSLSYGRSLELDFYNDYGFVRIGAIVGPVVAIPEPTSLSLVVLAISLWFLGGFIPHSSPPTTQTVSRG